MSGNTWWLTKVGEKLLYDLAIFLIFSFNIPLDFHELIQLELQLKYLMHFVACINTK